MYHRRETTWIGFQEAQKTICNLKQEVEIAEKKLLNAKRSFYEKTDFKSQLQSEEPPFASGSIKPKEQKQSPHFLKETLPGLSKFANISNEKTTVPKELLITSEEEPNFLPSKLPHNEPPDFKIALVKSSLDNLSKFSSSEDSFSTSDVKQSSEGTSSLIASTYRDANKLFKKHEARINEIPSAVSKSSTSLASDKTNKMPSIDKSSLLISRDIDMEWKPVFATNKKAFILQNKFKPDGIQKLKNIIEQQKKKQEQYQIELENDLSLSFEPPEFQKFKTVEDHSLESEEQIIQVPVRKVCLVKSLPVYKGFSAPPNKWPSGTRWRKQKNKYAIAKSSNTKSSHISAPKRIKTVVKCESDFVSASYWKATEKTNLINGNEKLNQAVTDDHSKTSSGEKIENHSPENKDENDGKVIEENTVTKIDTESVLKEKQPSSDEESSDSYVEDTKNESFSYEAKLHSELLNTLHNDENSFKENKRPLKSKAIKRKAKKPPDQKLPSPKIRHYDVEKIRDYIKKKKEERRKRNQEEYKKRMYEVQKKKESLEKLYEYHKQNKKSVIKGKPLSPIKIFQKSDVLGREHENQHVSISNNENFVKDSAVHKTIDIKEKKISGSKYMSISKKYPEEFEKKDILAKNQINLHKTERKSEENLQIDISIPKLISEHVSVQSHHQKKQPKDGKDSVQQTSSEENPVKRNKKIMKLKHLNQVSSKSSMQESTMNKIRDGIVLKPSFQNEEAADTQDSFEISDMFKSISSVSTPSEISHIVGVNLHLLEGKRKSKVPVPEIKSKKAEALKGLIKSINMMTKPLEPFLRTRKWVEDNPPPPTTLKTIISKDTDISNKQHLEVPKKSLDFHHEISESVNSKNSSFKEQISGIGDVSQLYAKILGRKSTIEPVQNIQKDLEFADNLAPYQHNETEDELIEGTLDSEEFVELENEKNIDFSHHSHVLVDSTEFSDFQKASIVPDPFNLINTWKRKPLGLSLHKRKPNETEGISVPSKYTENVSFEDMYKKLLNTSHTNSETKHTENDTNNLTFPSQGIELPSFTSSKQSAEQSVSRENAFSDSVCKMSNQNATSLSNHSFEGDSGSLSSSYKSSCISHELLSKHSEKFILDEKESSKDIVTVEDSSAEKISEPLNSNGQSLTQENIANHSTKDDAISENLQESNLYLNVSSVSDMLISGTINSQYSLEIETEESNKEEVEKSIKEIIHDRASASGSSISEVISVVENSKGFRSSAEDLQLDKIVSPKSSVHISADEKSNNESKVSTKSSSYGSGVPHSKLSDDQEKKSSTIHLSRSSEKDSEHSVILLKNDHLQSIPSGSQNSVTIDFRQPLRLTLSNGESVRSNQGMDLHENQYLHTQVVTRVASEAAAAAATSAVIAVFETQKALLAEKNYLGVLNAFGRSSSSKKTQYSSDFESSHAAKSSSHNSQSSAVESRHSKSIPEYISGESNNELSLKNGLVKEKILSEYSIQEENGKSKSSQSSSVKTEENVTSIHSQDVINESQKIPQRSKRKISGNVSSPSPASLSDNESISSETIMSSHSNFSLQSESVHSDDSFAQLTLDVVRRMTHEEELRARHQLSLLQFQEKTLVEKARAEMMWLELLKKKLREKGAERKISSIKRRQKELILRLRQERAQLQCMQEAYRSICEKHRSLLEDKKKLLKEPNSLAFQLLSKDEKPFTSKYSESKLKDFSKPKSSSSTPTIASDSDLKIVVDEESVSEVPEILKGLASNSSQESVVETQASEPMKTSNSSQNKSQRSSPNQSFSPLNATQSNSNPSLHSNNSLETALQGLKKLEASKRHLTKREQRILQRRKQVESLLQWQMKLDSEEMAVRELEQKALDLVDHSKKRAKYYISSSGSTNQDDDKRKESVYESLPHSEETPNQSNNLSDKSQSHALLSSANENKTSQLPSDESIHTNISDNNLEEGGTGSEKESAPQVSSAAHSSGSLPEEIKSASGGSSIPTVETTENGSHIDEVATEEMSYQVSPLVKDKSSSSEIYSESFDSSASRKTPSVLSASSPFKNSSPSRSIKKDGGPGIRLPLVPRNLRRHDSSGSDDSYTISQSETASDQSDIEVRIHALTEELKRRKAEAEKLKRKKYREQLKEKELSLHKQLEAYNLYINQAKLELEHQIESAVSPPQAGDLVMKPRIKWPRPEQVIDSRRVRKQTARSADSFVLEKKPDYVSSSPENTENSVASLLKEEGKLVKKLFPETTFKVEEESNSKEISEKSVTDSKEVSETLSGNISSEIQEVSEIEQSKSVSSEVYSDIKEISEANENSTTNSVKLQKLEESKSSDSEQKQFSVVSSLDENKSSHDTAESKSQTDTFITESSSSRSLDSNSPKPSDDNNGSNKSVSSEDEQNTKVMKEFSGDISQKSDTQYSQDMSQDFSSSEDSISEVQSVINSLSAGEDLEEENSSKNSKCNSSDGCEISPKNKVYTKNDLPNNFENKTEQFDSSVMTLEKQPDVETEVQAFAASPIRDKKKLMASQSEIINIVNYISSSLLDDAFQTFYDVSNKKCLLRSFLDIKHHEGKSSFQSQNMKEKTAEAISTSLFDRYLKDALDSFFKIVKSIKNNAENSSFLLYKDIKCYKDDTILNSTDILSSNVSDALTKTESSEGFQPNMIQDINDNEILSKQAFWTTDNFIASEREQQIQQLEQQLVLQQYSYFYRKIPNKPPPPYTPPSSGAISTSSYEFPLIKEKPIEKSTTIKEVTKHIDQVADHAIKVLLDGKQHGLTLSKIFFPTDDSITDMLELTTPHQQIFLGLIFDLTKEVVLEQYSETEQIPQPWLRPRKLTPKPLIYASKEFVSIGVKKEIRKVLKVDADPSNMNQRKQVLWSSLKLGRKKRDFVDTILISELKEEEPDWVNYDQDEVTVKLHIADSIFNLLIGDTINVIKGLQQKISRMEIHSLE